MRRRWLGGLGVVLLLCGAAEGGTKTTVEQLRGMLAELRQEHKADDQVANRLKDLELTEPLTESAMHSFADDEPGLLTLVQLRILALESALLAPPDAELPKVAAPDAAMQGAMMKRMVEYIAKRYSHVPRMTADKILTRYQNGPEEFHAGSGQKSQMAVSNPGVAPPNPYFRYMGKRTAVVPVQGGIELPGLKTNPNSFVSQQAQVVSDGSGPVLGVILLDAAKGKLSWQRWQMIDGRQVGVFAYAVPRSQSHYQMSYCCFPKMESIGIRTAGIEAWGVATSFEPFESTPGYHGELFVDPATGEVVRVILQTDMKPEELVVSEETRLDFGEASVGGAAYILPLREVTLRTVVPFGDSFQVAIKQRTLLNAEFANYR